MDLVSVVVGGIIGFLSSLATWSVQRWREKRDQRRVAFDWLLIEVERNLEKLCIYQEKEHEWRDPSILQIRPPVFREEAYRALIYRGPPFAPQDRDPLKKAASFYDRLRMIEFLVQRFNERLGAPQNQESLDNLMKAVKAAQVEGESLMELLGKEGGELACPLTSYKR